MKSKPPTASQPSSCILVRALLSFVFVCFVFVFVSDECSKCDCICFSSFCSHALYWNTLSNLFNTLLLLFFADKQANKTDEEKATAEAQFKAVNEAYEVLSCSEKKQK